MQQTLALLAILALGGLLPVAASADGDPASDVLASQSVFLPQDAAIPTAQQAQIAALLAEAAHHGYPIRVALITSATDLGSVTELWRQPQRYAQFLGQELSLIYRGPLLVVMPNGFGFNRFAHPPADERTALATIRPAARGTKLAAATLAAVERLATAAGHPLTHPSTPTTAAPGSSDTTPWIVFALGAGLIAAAWAASLLARPPHLPRRKTRPG